MARGALVGSGMLALYLALGLALGAVGTVLTPVMGWLIPVFGVAFIALGASVVTGRAGALQRFLPWATLLSGEPHDRPGSLIGFGVVYGAAAHGCSLPIFLGIVLAPLATGNVAAAVIVTLVYGATLTACLLVGTAARRAQGRPAFRIPHG